jgi:hypothetical protein
MVPGARSNNLEIIFSAAEALQQAGLTSLNLENRAFAIDEIVRDIQIWIWKTYQQIPTISLAGEQRKSVSSEPYDGLFRLITELGISDRLGIITTNYDILAEYYAWAHDISVRYPFPWDRAHSVGVGEKRFVCPSDGIPVCKLHGSINYFVPSGHTVDYPYVFCDVGVDEPIVPDGPRYQCKPTVLAFDAIWWIRRKYTSDLTPALIPPSYAKIRAVKWLNATWNRALDLLRAARTLIFVGYSLPPTDGFMEALLIGAEAVREADYPLDVHVIDCAPRVHRRYRRLFGKRLRVTEPRTFSEAIVDGALARILSEATGA